MIVSENKGSLNVKVYGFIYRITNIINGKHYIGQTLRTVQKRFSSHCWNSMLEKCNMPITRAIRKYGKNNFDLVTLCECASQLELDEMEIRYVKDLKTFVPHGYNLKAGQGRGITSEITKKRIGDANRGKKVGVEARQHMSDAHKGKKLSDTQVQKLRDKYRGRQVSSLGRVATSLKSAKTFLFMDPHGVILCIRNMRQYCVDYGLSPSKMCLVSQGKRNYHKGWRICTSAVIIGDAILVGC